MASATLGAVGPQAIHGPAGTAVNDTVAAASRRKTLVANTLYRISADTDCSIKFGTAAAAAVSLADFQFALKAGTVLSVWTGDFTGAAHIRWTADGNIAYTPVAAT